MKAYWGSVSIDSRVRDLGTRAGLDAMVKRKIPSSCRESNLPIIQPVAQLCSYRILVGKPLRKRKLGRPRGWEDNIKMDFKEISFGWKYLRVVSLVDFNISGVVPRFLVAEC
jgi:hypothetical protein